MPQKIFVISLPRTATTSLCLQTLNWGFKVAHTAFTRDCFDEADVIADTPVFYCYPKLDSLYPGSKFIYLERDMNNWLPSIKQLLLRMERNLIRKDGGFHPLLKKSYNGCFSDLTASRIVDDSYLTEMKLKHKCEIENYFNERQGDILYLDFTTPTAMGDLADFLSINLQQAVEPFPHVNKRGKITYWKSVKSPLKIDSHLNRTGRDFWPL